VELWLAWLYVLLAAAVLLGSIRWLWRTRPEGRTVRVLVHVAGLLTTPVAFVVTLFLVLAQGCERHSPLIGSPDGKHVARVLINVGSAMDQDYSTVIMRRSWSPVWRDVYFGLGFYGEIGPIQPQVKWLDNSHLLIRRPESAGYPLDCAAKVQEIVITCEAHGDER
jgi:hypothetical protein